MMRAEQIEVGVKGSGITVRGTAGPQDGKAYGSEQELELTLPQARELLRLLRHMIPLAEKATAAAGVVAIKTAVDAS